VQTPPGYFQSKRPTTDHVADRSLGGFAGWPSANDWVSAEDWFGDRKLEKWLGIDRPANASSKPTGADHSESAPF
jgi:hypothetical protein